MIRVYARLSLQESDVRKHLPSAQIAPPVKRGDLACDYQSGVRLFLIVDGEFQQSLAVSPNEILDVMRAGALVYGSSSIGALRAVELEKYGMRGCGKIYEAIKDSDIFFDDDLGHLYDQESFEIYTIPRIELDIALNNPRLSRKIRQNLQYTELSLATIEEFLKKHLESAERTAALKSVRRYFEVPAARQKNRDAIELLKFAKRQLTQTESLNLKLNQVFSGSARRNRVLL